MRHGDEELADAIDTVLAGRATTLAPLDLDLEVIADALTEPAGSVGYLDLHTGFVTTEAMLDNRDPDENTDLEDRSRWLPVPGEGSDAPYRDMRHFIATVPDPRLAQRLTDAIDGRGAFRRFYDASPLHRTSTLDGSDTAPTHDSDAPEGGSPTTDTSPKFDNRARNITPDQGTMRARDTRRIETLRKRRRRVRPWRSRGDLP